MKQTSLWYWRMLQLLIQNPLLLPTNTLLLVVPQCDEIHPLNNPLQFAACILFRNKFLTKEFTNSTTKIILQYWCNLSFKKNCYKLPLLEKQTKKLENQLIWSKPFTLGILVSTIYITSWDLSIKGIMFDVIRVLDQTDEH